MKNYQDLFRREIILDDPLAKGRIIVTDETTRAREPAETAGPGSGREERP